RWTTHKWVLMITVILVLLYALAGLGYAIMTWFNAWDKAVVMTVADMDILTVITLTAALMLFTSLVGIVGTLLDSRPIVAVYALLLWPCLICLLSVGYVSYKRVTFSLDHKLNLSWSRYYTKSGRLAIQDSLGCCGFYGPLHDTTPSTKCYLRTPLPGCKAMLYDFESRNLRLIWQGMFALVPVHLVNVIAALLCANHITKSFGKGMTPKQYRLSALDVKEDAHRILGSFNGKHIEEVGYAKLPLS
ncbi:Tetraspanin family-domain-containing protein, partial [Panaeolus papilionaceus]